MATLSKMALRCALACTTIGALYSGGAYAQDTSSKEKQDIDALKEQIQLLMKKVDELSAKQASTSDKQAQIEQKVAAATMDPGSHQFLERKAGDGIIFLTRGGEVSLYGNLDISIDDTTKGLSGMSGVAGNGGWLPAISTNMSYVGIRGFQAISNTQFKFLYQLETQIDVSATSGTGDTNSNTSNAVKGGLTSRNSFIGISSPTMGAFKIGKTDAPYKTSTARMNPFSGMLGDYAVIMGNTGGDNRVEFGTRLDHALWYESPDMHGFSFNALISPGQNRGYDNSNIAAGESDCSGGNVPGSGGTPAACNDGSYGNAYSASLSYSKGPLYLTAAYELHKGVNRTSDLAAYDPNDVANEDAAKVGVQYKFPSKTTISAIYENMRRHVPAYLDYQNERSRSGYWLALSQDLSPADSLHFGWGHANQATGDPGQHNTAGGLSSDNVANLYTLAWKHQVDKNFSTYVDYAMTANHASAHYDLGAGGRGVTTDCHDASNPDSSGFDPNGGAPHCFAGGKLQGVSAGMKYVF
jgi:predicted porin